MRRRAKQAVAVVGVAVVVTLMWPGPSSADTSLSGYSAAAQAAPIRVQVYEPIVPIPSSPQVDASIGYTRSSTDTGPVSRATASYLWPGDVIGDGFNQLVGTPNASYPVQVNSRNPPTPDAPASNTAQLTDGNGMTTSATDTATKADVTGLGIAGTNVLSGLLKGIQNIVPGAPRSTTSPVPQLPIPVSNQLSAIVNVGNLKSDSDITIGQNSVTSTAHATMSNIKLLGGLLTISGFDVSSTTVSDGKKATTSGSSTIGALSIAGQKIALDDQGIELAGQKIKLPGIPDLLATLGISIKYLQSTKSVQGATGSLDATGMEITVDTAPLKNLLGVSALTGPLEQLLEKIPQIGGQLGALTQIGPKIVVEIGSVSTSATASPAFDGGGTSPTTGGSTTPTGGGQNQSGGTTTGSGTGGVGGGTIGAGSGGGSGGGSTNTTPTSTQPLGVQPTALNLPPLGQVPRLLIVGALALAAVIGWLLSNAAGTMFGVGANCHFGLATGVPDLRKG